METREAARKLFLLSYFSKWNPVSPFSVEETAKILRVTPETVRSYIATGELGAEIVGNSYRITVEDLKDFLTTKSKGLHFHSTRRCSA